MTKEETIKQIEKLKSYCEYMADSDESGAYLFDLDGQALDLALSVLRPISREQVEKVWRGEWLNFYNDFSTAECSRCGELFEVSPGETPQEDYFNAFKEFYHFCPSCGALMTDESVQMVVERMETLHENRD